MTLLFARWIRGLGECDWEYFGHKYPICHDLFKPVFINQ